MGADTFVRSVLAAAGGGLNIVKPANRPFSLLDLRLAASSPWARKALVTHAYPRAHSKEG